MDNAIEQVTVATGTLHKRRAVCMCSDDGSFVTIQRFKSCRFVHMAEIENEIMICHRRKQPASLSCQWTRFASTAAETRSCPCQADNAQTQIPPFSQFIWRPNALEIGRAHV